MKKTLFVMGALAATLHAGNSFAQNWSENFNSGFPANWILHNVDGKTPHSSVNFVTDAWVMYPRAVGDSIIVSTSYYNPAGAADDWVVTHDFTVNDAATILKWDERAFNSTFADGYEVRVSTTGTNPADFTTVLYSTAAANAADFATKYVSLAAYDGQNIRIAFRNNSNDKLLLGLDNIEVLIPADADLSLAELTPSAGHPTAYGVANGTVTLGGKVFNNSINNVTAFTAYYQLGSNTVVSNNITGVNIAPFSSADFTYTTPLALPATLGDYDVKAWIELPNDNNALNDSSSTTITTASFMPAKKIFIEEGTGTWCGWCPRGTVYMDSVFHTYPNNFSLVAVHNGDPMVVNNYDAFIGSRVGGYPSMLVDRRDVLDPGDLIDVYWAQKDYFGFADITLTNQPANGFDFSVTATVRPAVNLSGDYRLALVLTEDDVHGTGSGWAQVNYYSHQSLNIPLTGGGFDWQAENNPVAASKMYYDFVARAILPSPTGAASSLPATMTAGNTYDYTFTTTINPGYKRDKMRAVVALIRNSDGHVLNSNSLNVPLSVATVNEAVSAFSIFPNPAQATASVRLGIAENTAIGIQVVDAMGRVVKTIPEQQLAQGNHLINIQIAELPAGLYHVKVQTDKGTLTQRLSVIK